jgi:hypothetical protein
MWIPWQYLVAIAGIVVGGVAIWMDYRHKQRLADIVKAAIDAGQSPPKELLDALTGKTEAGGGETAQPKSRWTNLFVFLPICAGFAAAAWWAWPGKTAAAFAAVAAIMAAAAIVTLGLALARPKDRP